MSYALQPLLITTRILGFINIGTEKGLTQFHSKYRPNCHSNHHIFSITQPIDQDGSKGAAIE